MRDYAELVKALRTCELSIPCTECPFYSNGDAPSKECATMNVAAADAIEELIKVVPRWISVEERLPENGKFVLVSDGDDIDTACRYKALTPDEVETFFWDSVLEVTHWMPLPEPPKEDAE